MTDPESRLARVEERLNSHDKQIDGLEHRMDTFAPIFTLVATLSEKVAALNIVMQSLTAKFDSFENKIEERDEAAREDRRQFNRWLVGLAVLILCALVGVTATVLTTGGHP